MWYGLSIICMQLFLESLQVFRTLPVQILQTSNISRIIFSKSLAINNICNWVRYWRQHMHATQFLVISLNSFPCYTRLILLNTFRIVEHYLPDQTIKQFYNWLKGEDPYNCSRPCCGAGMLFLTLFCNMLYSLKLHGYPLIYKFKVIIHSEVMLAMVQDVTCEFKCVLHLVIVEAIHVAPFQLL